jgi:hypothetical protein
MGYGGVVEAFLRVYYESGHLTALVRGGVRLRKWVANCVGCE